MIGFGETPTVPQCSAEGCRERAAWSINWRNPKIHDASRVKVWAACDEHRDTLHDYLASRGLPVAITPFGIVLERIDD